MGTKENPGKYDCLAKVAPDEPIFILRGRDVCAPEAVRKWARMALDAGCPREKVDEALACADKMEAYPNRKYPD